MIDFCNGHADDAGIRCAESKKMILYFEVLSTLFFQSIKTAAMET